VAPSPISANESPRSRVPIQVIQPIESIEANETFCFCVFQSRILSQCSIGFNYVLLVIPCLFLFTGIHEVAYAFDHEPSECVTFLNNLGIFSNLAPVLFSYMVIGAFLVCDGPRNLDHYLVSLVVFFMYLWLDVSKSLLLVSNPCPETDALNLEFYWALVIRILDLFNCLLTGCLGLCYVCQRLRC